MFVRIMRDEGYDFYRQDKYCENMFAKFFDISDFEKDRNLEKHFELLTAFEVFEHLKNPLDEISNMFFYSDTILFTTEMYKEEYLGNTRNWWYFSPATGQHIVFIPKKHLNIFPKNYPAHITMTRIFTFGLTKSLIIILWLRSGGMKISLTALSEEHAAKFCSYWMASQTILLLSKENCPMTLNTLKRKVIFEMKIIS